ncbi:MAG: aminotransferase class III-fold pyridoxal phosphate-dependent enzyme [Gammaproteobacteria bacterium]|nr:aminotransferase class III-fold pyridoxal phosphate-dependent enzyme [Gammaproteobacteria bacterium]MDH3447535.1 aminotransferase class III-fold pyridoxal phosphate-dependent enzyme [Gammaproteobacteria bacterium]
MSSEILKRNLPRFEIDEVRDLARDLYGFRGDFSSQSSERDLSWRLRLDSGETVVLKIANGAEPEAIVDLQVKALEHIASCNPRLPVPQSIASRNGRPYEWVESGAGDRHMMRVLSYLPGDTIESRPEALGGRMRFALGAMMAEIDLALRSFFHPAARSNDHLWELARCLELRPQIELLVDEQLRQLCHRVLDHAAAVTLPHMQHLRWQVIHQDADARNVLVDPDDPQKPVGILDFGDMLYGPIVAEIATMDTCARDEKDPVGCLCDTAAGFDSRFALEEAEVDLLYDAALIRHASNVILIAGRDAIDDSHGYLNDTGKYAGILRRMIDEGRDRAIRRIRAACRFPVYAAISRNHAAPDDAYDDLAQKRRRYLGEVVHFYDRPLHFVRGEGPWLITPDGRRYLDSYNNVQQIGHANAHVARALYRQSNVLNVNTRYLCDIVADYAERLTADLPAHLNACVFVNSGSEANDVAMQLAKFATGRDGALVMHEAYHGCTETTMELSPSESGRFDHLEYLEVPDMYRGRFAADADAAQKYAADVDRALTDLARRGHEAALWMVDTALCSNGVAMAPDGYFDAVAQQVQAAGGLVVADEVQAGMGRLGNFWGFRAQGLEHVDMITMGKPVGNGHPLGVVITERTLIDRFAASIELFSTFGGNPVSCAAGMAVLDEIERFGLVDKGVEVGDYLRAQLRELAHQHPLIGDVRGKGMIVGLEFVTDRAAKTPARAQTTALIDLMLAENILVGQAGPQRNAFKMRPSFAWDREHVDLFIGALDRCLDQL